jgi:hypothetical protein
VDYVGQAHVHQISFPEDPYSYSMQATFLPLHEFIFVV